MAEDQVGLLAAAEDFAGQLNALVAEVLPGQQPSFLAEATADGMVTVAPARDDEDRERAPLWIVVKGSAREHQLLIRAEYVCHWDRSRRFLSVVSSQVRLSLKGVNDPLFRLHYDRGKREGDLPAAHLHVHGHRDELLYLLTLSERGRPKRLRARDKVPQMSGLHLPVGGERFRPTLEDVIEVAAVEFGAQLSEGWGERLEQERERFRLLQLRVAVRDAPDEAAEALRLVGYEVAAPQSNVPGTSPLMRQIGNGGCPCRARAFRSGSSGCLR